MSPRAQKKRVGDLGVLLCLSLAQSGGNELGLGTEADYQTRLQVRVAICPATVQNIQHVTTTM